MSINWSTWLRFLCVIATLSSVGCDDNDNVVRRVDRIGTAPTLISFNPIQQSPGNSTDFFARGINLLPSLAPAQFLPGGVCPTRPPFQVPFNIVVTGQGRSDLFIDQVQMRFIDRTGVLGGSLTLARSELNARFGSTTVPAFSTRSFPLTLPFGCAGVPVGTLQVVVVTGDSSTSGVSTSLSIDVR